MNTKEFRNIFVFQIWRIDQNVYNDFVLQGHPIIFVFILIEKKEPDYWGTSIGVRYHWKFCRNSQHTAREHLRKSTMNAYFIELLMYKEEEKKKCRRKKKSNCLSNHSLKTRLPLAYKTRARVLCLFCLIIIFYGRNINQNNLMM